MVVNCLLFAAYRDAAGLDELAVELPEGATVGMLLESVRASLRADWLPDLPVVAVNAEYSDHDTGLKHGDEVAIIPPIAGG